jgi:hypothetical protein
MNHCIWIVFGNSVFSQIYETIELLKFVNFFLIEAIVYSIVLADSPPLTCLIEQLLCICLIILSINRVLLPSLFMQFINYNFIVNSAIEVLIPKATHYISSSQLLFNLRLLDILDHSLGNRVPLIIFVHI